MFAKTAETLREFSRKFSLTPFERKVYDALSNENWGTPNSTLLELAQSSSTFNDYLIITRELWLALDEKPDKWRRIFKALVLIEFLVKFGNPRIADELATNRLTRVKSLTEFRFFEDGRDRSGGIKEKAGYIVRLLSDSGFLAAEKLKASTGKDKFEGLASSGEIRSFVSATSVASGPSLRQETVTTQKLDLLKRNNDMFGPKSATIRAPEIDLLDFDGPKSNNTSDFGDFGDFQAAAVKPGEEKASKNPFDLL